MISLPDAKRAIYRLAEQAVRDVWTEKLGEPPEDGAIRMDGEEAPDTFQGDYYTISRVTCPPELQNLAGIGLTSDSTAQRYRYKGLLFIKVCGAKSDAGSDFRITDIADALKKKFVAKRDPSTGIAFTVARFDDTLRKDGQWWQVYMSAEWECDEVLSVAG